MLKLTFARFVVKAFNIHLLRISLFSVKSSTCLFGVYHYVRSSDYHPAGDVLHILPKLGTVIPLPSSEAI